MSIDKGKEESEDFDIPSEGISSNDDEINSFKEAIRLFSDNPEACSSTDRRDEEDPVKYEEGLTKDAKEGLIQKVSKFLLYIKNNPNPEEPHSEEEPMSNELLEDNDDREISSGVEAQETENLYVPLQKIEIVGGREAMMNFLKEYDYVIEKDNKTANRVQLKGLCLNCGESVRKTFASIKVSGPHCRKCVTIDTSQRHFGLNSHMLDKTIQKRMQDTSLRNHGTKHPMQNKKVKNKAEETTQRNWGMVNAAKHPEVIQKIKDSKIKNREVRKAKKKAEKEEEKIKERAKRLKEQKKRQQK